MLTQMALRARIALTNLVQRENGATAVEYGLMVFLIAVAIIVAVTALGVNLTATFNCVVESLKDSTYTCPVAP